MHRSIDDVCKNWTGSSIIKCPRSEAIKLVIFVHLEVLILFGYLTLLFWALAKVVIAQYVGRVVASDSRGLRFESSHRQNLYSY